MTSEAFDRQYKALNSEQKRAVDTIEGPVMVIAGPGSGKTQILSLRVANILIQTDTRPGNILCLTFTESAASNMRDRLSKVIGHDAYKVQISTFHGFCTDVIGRYPGHFYNGATFMPADDLTQLEILGEIFSSLEFDNPLRKEHPEEGFIYLNSVKRAIADLKKAGLSAKEFASLIEHNEEALAHIKKCIEGVFDARMSMKGIESMKGCADKIGTFKHKKSPVETILPITTIISKSLTRAINEALTDESTAPLTAWKQKWIKKEDDGSISFKDGLYLDKMRALAHIYDTYLTKMHEQGYFDFDDMLLQVIQAAEKHKALRYELQEQFQYILVDEFQDTNDAQLRLLRLIANSEVNEGKPNIMSVGDDDQAIYKFQGAEVSNMLNFQRLFGDPAIIVLKNNYRSTQSILNVARHLITQGHERLEKLLPELSKELTAAGAHEDGVITSNSFPSPLHQYSWIAKDIAQRIKAGTPAQDIAIIARTHRVLEELVPFLHEHGVPVSYDRQQNVFEEPHISQLITVSRFIASLARKERDEADEFLPELLSFPFWGLDRKSIWQISVDAYKNRTRWMDIMLNHKDTRVKDIAEFLLDLSGKATHEPLERLLDIMIGSHVELQDDGEEGEEIPLVPLEHKKFISPFKDYYFSKEKYTTHKVEYLTFLSSLRAFIESLREYKKGKRLSLTDLVTFVDLHTKHGILVTDQSPFASGSDSIHLLSAHKAKGLEFDTVYVASCQEDIWAGRGRSSILPFPINLPITAAGDTSDDHLRLFYVALTRAKRNLILTSYEINERGSQSMRLGFLAREADGDVKHALTTQSPHEEVPDAHHVLISAWESYNRPPFIYDELVLLKKLVEEYQMSVTHLNNFLDVTRGGPKVFLEQNLLQFPQSKTPSGAYGTAMHAALECTYSYIKAEGKKPTITKVLQWFDEALTRERLGDQDLSLYRLRGEKALRAYYEAKRDLFNPDTFIEFNFKNQGVRIGDAHLSGKIDKITKADDGSYIVYDFKTGAGAESWDGSAVYEKIKLHRYKRQLVFYKILVEHSRQFEGSTVSQGILEFLEPYKSKIIDLSLLIEEEDVTHVKKLIEAVYKKICTLDFPDTTKYPQDLAGILAFEEDLLK